MHINQTKEKKVKIKSTIYAKLLIIIVIAVAWFVLWLQWSPYASVQMMVASHPSEGTDNGDVSDIFKKISKVMHLLISKVDLEKLKDSDRDGVENYLDSDNDGLLDVNEQPEYLLTPLEHIKIKDSEEAKVYFYSRIIDSVSGQSRKARVGHDTILSVYNLRWPIDDVWVIILNGKKRWNIKPHLIDSEGRYHFKCPSGVETNRLATVRLAYKNKYFEYGGVVTYEKHYPFLTGHSIDRTQNKISFQGFNLSSDLTIKFIGATVNYDNSSGNPHNITIDLPPEAKSGYACIWVGKYRSNHLSLTIERIISGKVVLPKGSTVPMSDLTVSWSSFEKVCPDTNGNFMVHRDKSEPSVVTVFRKEPNKNPYVFLQALTHPTDTELTFNSTSTAIALVWKMAKSPYPESDYYSITRDLISELPEVSTLANVIEAKLAIKPTAIVYKNVETLKAIQKASGAARNAIENNKVEHGFFSHFIKKVQQRL